MTGIEYGDGLEQEAGWLDYYCLVAVDSKIKVRRTRGGEAIGHCDVGQKARVGHWICLNPLNGHRWEMSDDSLHEFYAEKGKGCRPPQKQNIQHGKGGSGHSRTSAVGSSWTMDDVLFAGLAGLVGNEGKETTDDRQKQEAEEEGAESTEGDDVNSNEVV